MSVMGVIATNLHCASKLLGRYNLALESVVSRGGYVGREDEARSLLAVLAPLSRHLRGKSYYALGVHGEEMSEFLRLRHRVPCCITALLTPKAWLGVGVKTRLMQHGTTGRNGRAQGAA